METQEDINRRINQKIGYEGDPRKGYSEHKAHANALSKWVNHPIETIGGLSATGGLLAACLAAGLRSGPGVIAASAGLGAGLSGLASYAYRQKAIREKDKAWSTFSDFADELG